MHRRRIGCKNLMILLLTDRLIHEDLQLSQCLLNAFLVQAINPCPIKRMREKNACFLFSFSHPVSPAPASSPSLKVFAGFVIHIIHFR